MTLGRMGPTEALEGSALNLRRPCSTQALDRRGFARTLRRVCKYEALDTRGTAHDSEEGVLH